MPDLEGVPPIDKFEPLKTKYYSLVRGVLKLAVEGRRIIVVTHLDADGITSGSIVFAALMRKGANVVLRCVPDLDHELISKLGEEKHDFYIFTDLASTLIGDLEAVVGGRFLVIDHHQLADADKDNPMVVNAWNFGLDGGKEASSASMAYFFATAVDPSNRDLSPLAVVGAVADRQDRGPDRSLNGLNGSALQDAKTARLVSTSRDLLFTGRETRPIHESVALTSAPFLKGVTGNKEAVLAALHQSGLRLKDGGAWRTISSLSNEEKMKVTEVVAGLTASAGDATESISELVGDVYTLELEDPLTPLRDAREFATLLNACGRMGRAGTGVSVCLGDRTESLSSAIATLTEYRGGIGRALKALSDDATRTTKVGGLVVVHAEGLVEEKLLGPVISILTSSPGYSDKVVVGFASSGDTELKVSSRVGDAHTGGVNLGLVMRGAAEAVNGVGGGHGMAAGAKIPSSQAEAFSKLVSGMLPS